VDSFLTEWIHLLDGRSDHKPVGALFEFQAVLTGHVFSSLKDKEASKLAKDEKDPKQKDHTFSSLRWGSGGAHSSSLQWGSNTGEKFRIAKTTIPWHARNQVFNTIILILVLSHLQWCKSLLCSMFWLPFVRKKTQNIELS
jgi:hypothetical protein